MTGPAADYLERLATPLVADAAHRIGSSLGAIGSGIRPLDPGSKIAGPAATVEANNDLVSILAAVHRAESGDVVVVANHTLQVGLMGDLIGTEAVRKGLAGFIVGGHVRDARELVGMGLPVFSLGTFPVGPLKVPAADRGIGVLGATVEIGGVSIAPGSWVFGDDDGVVVIGAVDLDGVLAAANDAAVKEDALASEIRAGVALGDLFDLDAFLAARIDDPTVSFAEHLERLGRAI